MTDSPPDAPPRRTVSRQGAVGETYEVVTSTGKTGYAQLTAPASPDGRDFFWARAFWTGDKQGLSSKDVSRLVQGTPRFVMHFAMPKKPWEQGHLVGTFPVSPAWQYPVCREVG